MSAARPALLGRLLGREARPEPPPPLLPPGQRLYAVGDIHGRLDLLDAMEAAIAADLAARPVAGAGIVYLGDYVDRGPDSPGVLDRLAAPRADGVARRYLRGNHEATMSAFLADAGALDGWRRFGGLETLAAYGVDVAEAARGRGFDAARLALLARLPDAHRTFLDALEPSLTAGGYLFAHAGVRPGVALDAQDEADLIWIREPFLSHEGDLGAVVVHGHTPAAEPQLRPHRIGIDLGAYATGRLGAAVLEGDGAGFLVVTAETPLAEPSLTEPSLTKPSLTTHGTLA